MLSGLQDRIDGFFTSVNTWKIAIRFHPNADMAETATVVNIEKEATKNVKRMS